MTLQGTKEMSRAVHLSKDLSIASKKTSKLVRYNWVVIASLLG
jgi:hypothetical protein